VSWRSDGQLEGVKHFPRLGRFGGKHFDETEFAGAVWG
jgi:hypothetical protein